MYIMEINAMGGSTFRIAATIVSLTCVFYTILIQRRHSQRSRLFLMLLSIVLVDSITGIIAYKTFTSSLPYEFRFVVCYCCRMIYFATHFALLYIFSLYIIHMCNLVYKFDRNIQKYLAIPIAIIEALLLSNPFTHLFFKVDNDIVFTREIGIYIAYFIGGLYFLLCFYILAKYWHTINHHKKIAMFYFVSLAVLGIIIQMIYPHITCELLCESIGLMGLMIMIEKEDDKLDSTTNAYNRSTFIYDLNGLLKMKVPFQIICIRIDNSGTYRRITGYENFDHILSEISDFLINLAGDYNVYKIGDANFFILLPMVSDLDVKNYADAIEERFNVGFTSENSTTIIVETILCAKSPEQFTTADDISLLADAPMENDDNRRTFFYDELDFLINNIAIEKAISIGLSTNNFSVNYQPIYDMRYGRIKAMQALLKLNDPKLGDINFSEFMPIAERAGLADTLEEKMIESIFRFAGTELASANVHPDFILIHLMSINFSNKNLVETIMGLKYKYNIDPSLIVFDIDDTILNLGHENLSYVLNELYDEGFGLFLGNYDLSNLGQNEDVLNKFRGVVLTAWKFLDRRYISHGNVVLKTRAEMLNELKKEVLITGVDYASAYEVTKNTRASYISGKYMAEPLSREEIIARFKNMDIVKGI